MSSELLRRQYEVERELADRLRRSERAERPALLRVLYEELAREIPEHPRLSHTDTVTDINARVAAQMRLLQPWLSPPPSVFLEFAPGAGHLSLAMCRHARRVYGVDISDQLAAGVRDCSNFELLLYDGLSVALPDNSVDLMFSYQLIEHIHPDDVPLHFALAHRLLRPGGVYVFATPHAFSGPHDISRWFSDVPQGFHLREWTYDALQKLVLQASFESLLVCRRGRYRSGVTGLLGLERLFALAPRRQQRWVSRRLFAGIVMAARKGA